MGCSELSGFVKIKKELWSGLKRDVWSLRWGARQWLPWWLTHLEPLTGISLKPCLGSSVRERKGVLHADKGSCLRSNKNTVTLNSHTTCWIFLHGGPGNGGRAIASLEAACQRLCISDDFICLECWIPGALLQLGPQSPQGPPWLCAAVENAAEPSSTHWDCPWLHA